MPLHLCIFFGTATCKCPRAPSPYARVLAIGYGPGTGAGMAERLSREDKRTIGRDIAKVQYGWPMGLPLCRPLSAGLWKVRASLPSKREARVFFGFHDGMLIAVHAMIKKTQNTADGRFGAGKTKI